MENWKVKILIFLSISAIIIGYPFFTIKFFETSVALKLVAKFLLIPILILLGIVVPKFYFTKIKSLEDKIQENRTQKKFNDFFSMIMMVIFSTLVLCGLSFSLIITTNKFFGTTKPIKINEKVISYESYITKNGRLRHYITFKNPKQNGKNIHLEVQKEFYVGELFTKNMKYGFWNILYSDN